jgi:hypothetical protein
MLGLEIVNLANIVQLLVSHFVNKSGLAMVSSEPLFVHVRFRIVNSEPFCNMSGLEIISSGATVFTFQV